MPMSLFKNNKNRNKVVNPYCSLGWLLIIAIFQKCAKLKPPWVHLGKQIKYYVQINVCQIVDVHKGQRREPLLCHTGSVKSV